MRGTAEEFIRQIQAFGIQDMWPSLFSAKCPHHIGNILASRLAKLLDGQSEQVIHHMRPERSDRVEKPFVQHKVSNLRQKNIIRKEQDDFITHVKFYSQKKPEILYE